MRCAGTGLTCPAVDGEGRPADPSRDELMAYRRRLLIRHRSESDDNEPRSTPSEDVWHCHRCSTTWKADGGTDGNLPHCWCCEQSDEVRPGPALLS